MSGTGEERFAERMLRELTGGVLDLERLDADAAEIADFVRMQDRLWALDVKASGPAPTFSPSWDQLEC